MDEQQERLQRLAREALKNAHAKLADYTQSLEALGHASGYAAGFRSGYQAALEEQAKLVRELLAAGPPQNVSRKEDA